MVGHDDVHAVIRRLPTHASNRVEQPQQRVGSPDAVGASGGVGTGCVILAKLLGAEVIACASSDEKLKALKDMGADEVVDYTKTDWSKWAVEKYGKPQRRSYWPAVFAEARECPGEWVRTGKWFNRSTAAQVASDVRNAHLREADKMRVKGAIEGERWETRWDNEPSDPDSGPFYIWLRLAAPARVARRELVDSDW